MSSQPVSLYRLSGGGNDFLALAEPAESPDEARIRAWCTRGLSLGADGLFVLRRDASHVVMDYFNADGRPAELCLNGTRCAARLSHHLGWCAEEVTLLTGSGPIRAHIVDARDTALELPRPAAPRDCEVAVDGATFRGWFVEVGVPHLVLAWSSGLATAPVATAGPALRRHPRFGDRGANVDFVVYLPPHTLELRTYERGVEAETLACGTAVIAAAAVGVEHYGLELPIAARTAGGFTMEVGPAAGGWQLAGDARLLAAVQVFPAADCLPEPRVWS